MTETPKRKTIECEIKIILKFLFSFVLISETLAPVIYDKYSGKSGSVQGERKDKIPATKATIIVKFVSIINCLLITHYSSF